jgi:hypothetical protein
LGDVSLLLSDKQFADTLAMHPNLQVYRIIDDDIARIMHCHVFYKGLIVFSSNYLMNRGKLHPAFFCNDPANIVGIDIDLNPKISSKSAIAIAHRAANFRHNCTRFQLGIYNIHCGISGALAEYKLVWNITADGGLPAVMLDAQTGNIVKLEDGIFH